MHPFGRWLPLAWRILRHWLPRYLVCWGLCLYGGYRLTYGAMTCWDNEWHAAGTEGHCTIDFGGQWFTGKLLLRGEGYHLYERHHQWEVMREAWPPDVWSTNKLDGRRLKEWGQDDTRAAELLCSYLAPLGANNNMEAAAAFAGAFQAENENREAFGNPWKRFDAKWLMGWLLGEDDPETAKTYASCVSPLAMQDPFGAAAIAIAGKDTVWTAEKMAAASKRNPGGNFYPPIHAFYYAPLALLDPVKAYYAVVLMAVPFALLAGWGLSKVTRGGLWMPLGTLLTMSFPHFVDAQGLGHNGSIIVAMLVWGYYYLQKNADIRGGIIWGLLAYKPSWAVTYFVMLLVSRRWKAALAMGACGLAQILLTLPFVGVHSWLEWRQVLAEGAKGYGIHENWVHVARDLISYPRRAWTDWSAPYEQRDLFKSHLAAYVLIGIALEVTARLTSLRGRRAKHWTYAAGAFLLLGFWMCCYRITYYDTIFATLPIAILLMVPAHVLTPYFFRRAPMSWRFRQQTLTLPQRNYGNICNPLIVYMLPLILWHPWTGEFIDLAGKVVAWPLGMDPGNFDELLAMLPEGWEWRQYFNQPLIVPFYAVCWLWAGWMWLRER